jgi:hypothetical protein
MTATIELTSAERMELTRRASSRTDRAEDARRARLILLLGEGHLHCTPTYYSWLDRVELCFGKIERDVIARGVFTSVSDLKRKLMRYIR